MWIQNSTPRPTHAIMFTTDTAFMDVDTGEHKFHMYTNPINVNEMEQTQDVTSILVRKLVRRKIDKNTAPIQ